MVKVLHCYYLCVCCFDKTTLHDGGSFGQKTNAGIPRKMKASITLPCGIVNTNEQSLNLENEWLNKMNCYCYDCYCY